MLARSILSKVCGLQRGKLLTSAQPSRAKTSRPLPLSNFLRQLSTHASYARKSTQRRRPTAKRQPEAHAIENKENSAPVSIGLERVAKRMARCGLCSRREAEEWIKKGRVTVDGVTITSPAMNVGPGTIVRVDGQPIKAERPRILVYNKTRGIVVTRQKEGQTQGEEQKALSEILQELNLSSFKWVGRLDVNTEGLLLLTNDGMLKRHLELPSSGYLRKYRVRVFGRVDPALLKELAAGVTIDGVHYKPITAEIESTSDERANSWLTMTLSEGKNREIKRVLEYLRLKVTRLIRVQYGPYGLGEIESGSIQEVPLKPELSKYVDPSWKNY